MPIRTNRKKKTECNLCAELGYRAFACVPILKSNRIVGFVHVANHSENSFSSNEIDILRLAALLLPLSIENIATLHSLQTDYTELERRFSERKSQLLKANRSLRKEIAERKRIEESLKLNEARLEALHRLNQMAGASFQEICNFALEEGVRLTKSQYGYLYFMNEDETFLTAYSWSKGVLDQCDVPGAPSVFPVAKTGLWGEAVRQRRPIITTDYSSPNPHKRGIPIGHVPILSHMNIPIFWDGRIVAVAGVANKGKEYVEHDVRQLQLLMEGMWGLIQRKRTLESLKNSEERLRSLTAQLINAQEMERRRISSELHDEMGQALMTLKLQIRGLQKNRRKKQVSYAADLEQVVGYIDEIARTISRISRDLRPPILEDLGLSEAIHSLLDQVSPHYKVKISRNLEKFAAFFPREKEILIFRIFQEALTNITRHAEASRISISFTQQEDRFLLTIEDNGKGFDPDAVLSKAMPQRGLGLSAMQERVRMVGGNLRICSETDRGTKLIFSIPFRNGDALESC